jgi:two-component system sensor histidine kinase KdpD
VAEGLLCKGWRAAEDAYALWYALHVETARDSAQKISPGEFRALLDNINLAIDLGAELVWLKSLDVANAIIEFARNNKISKIMAGRSHRGFWSHLYNRSIAEQLFHEAEDFDIEIVTDQL